VLSNHRRIITEELCAFEDCQADLSKYRILPFQQELSEEDLNKKTIKITFKQEENDFKVEQAEVNKNTLTSLLRGEQEENEAE